MDPIKQILVAWNNRSFHRTYWGIVPNIGEKLDGETILGIYEQPYNAQQTVVVIGKL